jgi:hypothetical protein
MSKNIFQVSLNEKKYTKLIKFAICIPPLEGARGRNFAQC